MRAAEKYAEIGGQGNAPLCECHGLPQGWHRSPRFEAGGFWQCMEKQRQYHRQLPRKTERRKGVNRSKDPTIPHPGMVFRSGHWISPQAVETKRKSERLYKESHRKQYQEREARRINMFGERFVCPDQDFKEFAIALREERRRHQTEGATRG